MKMTTCALSALAILTLGGAAAPDTAMAGGTWHWTDGYDGNLDLDRVKDRVESRLGALRGELQDDDHRGPEANLRDPLTEDASSPWASLSPTELWGAFLVYWPGSF